MAGDDVADSLIAHTQRKDRVEHAQRQALVEVAPAMLSSGQVEHGVGVRRETGNITLGGGRHGSESTTDNSCCGQLAAACGGLCDLWWVHAIARYDAQLSWQWSVLISSSGRAEKWPRQPALFMSGAAAPGRSGRDESDRTSLTPQHGRSCCTTPGRAPPGARWTSCPRDGNRAGQTPWLAAPGAGRSTSVRLSRGRQYLGLHDLPLEPRATLSMSLARVQGQCPRASRCGRPQVTGAPRQLPIGQRHHRRQGPQLTAASQVGSQLQAVLSDGLSWRGSCPQNRAPRRHGSRGTTHHGLHASTWRTPWDLGQAPRSRRHDRHWTSHCSPRRCCSPGCSLSPG